MSSPRTLAEVGIHLRHEAPGEHRTSCPECAKVKSRARDDALAVRVEPDQGATWLCHRCGWRGALGGVEHRPTHATKAPERPSGDLRAALALYRSARRIEPETVAAAYLSARACALPHQDGDLRYLEQYRHPSDYVGPALIALLTDIMTAEPRTVHQTWFRPDGTKAPVDRRRLLWAGLPKAGTVCRLWPDDDVTLGLAIAEGLETALALARGFGLTWACMDAGNLAALPVLPGIQCLTIAEDRDEVGHKATAQCAARWAAAGVEVRIARPSVLGWDVADEAAT